MAFSEVRRVVFAVNPLEEVICQLRFPQILKIDTEPPSSLQENIRTKYPFYKCRPAMAIGMELPSEIAKLLPKDFPLVAGRLSHEFASRDGRWTLTLTSEFIALSCKRYERWEEFRSHFKELLEALLRQYCPMFFVRIGLRYRNKIRRSALGLDRAEWSDLIQPWIAGPYASPEMKGEVENSLVQMQLRLRENRGLALVSCGAVRDKDEECYLIDGDFFIDRETEAIHALDQLDFLNSESGRFFHWCITDRLRSAFVGADRAS